VGEVSSPIPLLFPPPSLWEGGGNKRYFFFPKRRGRVEGIKRKD